MPVKKTLTQFIADAQKVHGNKYDYSLVVYLGNSKKIKIICDIHGKFEQTANDHLQGYGCKLCGYDSNSIDQGAIKVGDVFGNFTIIKPNYTYNKWSHRVSLAACSCGTEVSLRTADIVRGKVLSCRKCKYQQMRIKPIIGTQYGSWTIIDEEIELAYHAKFHVRCKCGLETFISHVTLRAGGTTQCRACRDKEKHENSLFPDMEGFSHKYFGSIKAGCQRKNDRVLSFEVDEHYLWSLFLKQNKKCNLSGLDLTFHPKRTLQTASLDRIDSSKGYIEGNVQWIHKKINIMKMDLDQDEFIRFCSLIGTHSSQNPSVPA